MGGGPPAGAQRVDVPDDNSVLLMPTTIRTAAVTRWVGRGNGPSRVTGASACPAAGDCYKNNYPHRALGAARITTAHRRFHTAQRMARRRISCIRSGFPVRRAVQGAAGCGSPQFLMRSGARMVRQTPARARMSPLWQLMAHRHFGHWTAGRTRRARRSPTVDDSQRGPTDSGTMHRLLLGHITDFRGGSVARRKRCYFDIGLHVAIFLLSGLPPKEKNDTLQTNPSQVTDDGREERTGYARAQRSRRWTANGRATLEIGQHRRCGGWQWVPVARVSSARNGVCWHGQLHRFLSRLIQKGADRGSHSRTRLACSTCEGASNQCGATSSLHQAQPRTERIRHWSRGAVRTTFRHFCALHVSLPVNRSHKPGNRMDGRQQSSISTYEGDSDQSGATSYLRAFTLKLLRDLVDGSITSVAQRMNWFETRARRQAESQCVQAYQQAERGEWAEAEKSLLEGSRRLAFLSQWIPTLMTQVEQGCRDVSGLLLAEEAERDGMVGPVLLSLRSVGCYAGET